MGQKGHNLRTVTLGVWPRDALKQVNAPWSPDPGEALPAAKALVPAAGWKKQVPASQGPAYPWAQPGA